METTAPVTTNRQVEHCIGLPKIGGPLLKTKEAADYLRISTRQVQYLSGRGELPCIRMGKSTRYTKADLEEFVSRHRTIGGQV